LGLHESATKQHLDRFSRFAGSLQCRINVGAVDAAALGPFKKYAHGHGREKNLLHFGCDFSVWYNFGKIIKTVATRCRILKLKCSKFDFGWGCAGLKRAYF